VGIVDREKIIDGRTIRAGDVVFGLPSAGLHTNGYSLARKLFFETPDYKPETFVDELGQTVGDALLQAHLSYLNALGPLLDSGKIKGLAHITGGGLLENIPRILPEGTSVEIKRGSWPVLPIFELMQRLGTIDESEMFRVFNMGIGMVVICAAEDGAAIRNAVNSCYEIGRVTAGSKTVSLI
jgi:phosphoribosylformylglycinamidine cyclo-ligase